MRRLSAIAALLLAAAAPAAAQQEQTLADIRQQLAVLQVEMQRLRAELNTTGAPGVGAGGSTLPDRVNAIEAELQRLTQATERMEFRIESVSRDGSARIEDLRFQLCELTPECDLGSLPNPGPLGGAAAGGEASGGPVGSIAPSAAPAGAALASGEQDAFDRAKAALDAGDAATAASGFAAFVAAYPTGPLTADAQLHLGQALARSGDHAGAARTYLEAFSGTPEGPRAPDALIGLGTALGSLGQTSEACLTLSEVAVRFPGSAAVAQAEQARAGLGCP